jgi:hypothetical protein
MKSRLFTGAVFAFLSLAAQAHAQVVEGACGGVMTGYDRRQYTCAHDRKPACDQATGRCVCVERRACGGSHDEPSF